MSLPGHILEKIVGDAIDAIPGGHLVRSITAAAAPIILPPFIRWLRSMNGIEGNPVTKEAVDFIASELNVDEADDDQVDIFDVVKDLIRAVKPIVMPGIMRHLRDAAEGTKNPIDNEAVAFIERALKDHDAIVKPHPDGVAGGLAG